MPSATFATRGSFQLERRDEGFATMTSPFCAMRSPDSRLDSKHDQCNGRVFRLTRTAKGVPVPDYAQAVLRICSARGGHEVEAGSLARVHSRSIVGLLVGILLLPACAGIGVSGSTSSSSPTTSENEVVSAAPLPTLPPPEELYPNLYDEEGCAIVSEDEVACPAPPLPGEDVDDTADPNVWRNLLGFAGPQYVSTFTAGEVVVLTDTVSTTEDGLWEAWGLVRNETSDPWSGDVTASLYAADGGLITEVSGHVLVNPIRPGEPGPFAIESGVDAEDVASVTWAVSATAPGTLVFRNFMIMAPLWELPYGDHGEDPPWIDPTSETPHPYVAFGSIANLGPDPVDLPILTAAWLDETGRVVWIEQGLVNEWPGDSERTAGYPDEVSPGSFGGADFFLFVSDPVLGPRIGDPTAPLGVMFWAASPASSVAST